jgi:hypothetical protein
LLTEEERQLPAYGNLAAVLKLMTAARSTKLGKMFSGTSRDPERKQQRRLVCFTHNKDTKQHPQIGFYDKIKTN